jgi:hypothetical protein
VKRLDKNTGISCNHCIAYRVSHHKRFMMMIVSMGRDYVSELRPPTGRLFIPQVMWTWRIIVEWCRQRKIPDSFTGALWQSYQQSSGSKQAEWAKGLRIRSCEVFLLILASGFFTCRKFSRHGASGFTSLPKERVLRIFIALKNPSPRLGLNPRTLGPVVTTLAITAPRRCRR